jgi:hypothetical protein
MGPGPDPEWYKLETYKAYPWTKATKTQHCFSDGTNKQMFLQVKSARYYQ